MEACIHQRVWVNVSHGLPAMIEVIHSMHILQAMLIHISMPTQMQACCRVLLEVLLEVLPVNLACQKGRLGNLAVLCEGDLVHQNAELAWC